MHPAACGAQGSDGHEQLDSAQQVSLGWSGKDGEFSARRVGITKLQLLAGNNVTSAVLSVRRKWRGGTAETGTPLSGRRCSFHSICSRSYNLCRCFFLLPTLPSKHERVSNP